MINFCISFPTLNFLWGGDPGLFDQISLRGGICDSKIKFISGAGSIHGLQSIFLFNPLLRKVVTIYQKIIMHTILHYSA